jgi:hypothetical protein
VLHNGGMDVWDELDIGASVRIELLTSNRLLPPRPDYTALFKNSSQVESQIRAVAARPGGWGTRASTVFADKTKGARPLSVLTLEDRVLYRALVQRLSETLPSRIVNRQPFTDFRDASRELLDAEYVTTLDVSSYFVYVDHELLIDELVAQTGDIAATDALVELLHKVMGRRIGLPQISTASDVLGDVHLDRVYRRLTRQGFVVTRFADDFRIFTDTLEDARRALESCAMELHALGLVLNADKTFTYGKAKYQETAQALPTAERSLFIDDEHDDDELTAFLMSTGPYGATTPEGQQRANGDSEDDGREISALGIEPVTDIDQSDATHTGSIDGEISHRLSAAARRAWELWESAAPDSNKERAIARTLVYRALPVLGFIDDRRPLDNLDYLMSSEPALTPDVVAYLGALPAVGGIRATREALSSLLQGPPPLSTWQKVWIASAAGRKSLGRRKIASTPRYVAWLVESLSDPNDGLAATAASSLGRLGLGDPNDLAAAVDRVGAPWRRLALWGLSAVDPDRARESADNRLDRLMLEA